MSKVSIIIPARNEIFLSKTIDDLFTKASGEIEVIVNLDGEGYLSQPPIVERKNLILIKHPDPIGMRPGINECAKISTGEFIMKIDGHCMVAEGYDEILKADCEDNWVVVPRRYSLEPETWTFLKNGKSPVDYHYLSYPWDSASVVFGLHGHVWNQRARTRLDILIDDEMSSQGSCWFMTKKHFDRYDGLPCEGYGTFIQEFQQIGMRTWLGGGRVIVNKNTWYAHLHKGKIYGRGYHLQKKEGIDGALYSADFWMNNKWKDRKYDIEWLIDKFWPVPEWPENWKTMSRDAYAKNPAAQ